MSALLPKADIVPRSSTVRLSAEAMGFDSVFLAWDFARKNQAESKPNFGEGAQGRAQIIMQFQMFILSHFLARSH
jgi:hypothetical protein